jgi:WD40 repeat protein
LFPSPTIAVAWGGMIKDQYGHDTTLYQLATIGDKSLCFWKLNPFQGTMERDVFVLGNYIKDYSCHTYSLDDKYLFLGTTSGELVCILPHNKKLVFTKTFCAKGVQSIANVTINQIVLGGGDGSLILLYINGPTVEELHRTSLYGSILSMSVSQDGVQMLASTDRRLIYRIRTADLTNIMLQESHFGGITMIYPVGIEKDYRFATASKDGTVRLWYLPDHSVYTKIFVSPTILPTSFCITEDIIVAGWNDGKLRCYRNDDSSRKYNLTFSIMDT